MKTGPLAVVLLVAGCVLWAVQNGKLPLPFEPSLPPGPSPDPVTPADPAFVELLRPLVAGKGEAADFLAGVFSTSADLVRGGQFKTRKQFHNYITFLGSVIRSSRQAQGVDLSGVITTTFGNLTGGGDLTAADTQRITADLDRLAAAARAL